jgi:hypothetical protein
VPGPADAFTALESSDAFTDGNNIAHCLMARNAILERKEFTTGYAVVGVTDAASQHLDENLTCTGLLEW